MSWLLREGDVLAAVFSSHREWRKAMEGAVLLRGPTFVHSIFPAEHLDVAWCRREARQGDDADYTVRRVALVPPRRVCAPLLGRGALVVARGGSFERWRLQVGDRLLVSGGDGGDNP